MEISKQIKEYVYQLGKNKLRFCLVLALIAFFISIPSRLIYSFPLDEKPNPFRVRRINLPIPSPHPYPVNEKKVPAPALSAASAIAVDVDSKAVIYMKNPDSRLLPASTTKMVTGLIASRVFEPSEIASISSPIRDGQIMHLMPGEQISIRNLLYGMLVYSANDAAEELAANFPGGREAFIERMNKDIKQMGLKDTHFTNPTGLEEQGHYSSVHDLAIIGAEVISNPFLAEIVNTKSITVTDTSGRNIHLLRNVNELLGVIPGLKGIKTGYTENAGECLVAYVERDNHRVITVILNSLDRFGETAKLMDWVFVNHEWQKIQLPNN